MDSSEVPPRKKKRKRKRRRASLYLVWGGLIICGAVLLLVGGGMWLYSILRRDPIAGLSKPAEKAGERQPSATQPPTGWQEIVSAPGRFRAVMPSPLVERSRTVPSAVGPVQDYQYLHEPNPESLSYSIAYADFSEAQLRKQSLEHIVDQAGDFMAKVYNGQVEVERAIERDGRRGTEFVIHVPGRGKFLMHYLIDGSRLYTIVLAGRNAALDLQEARFFFDSFHFADSKQP
jgi:hypothetical protein